MGSRRMEGSKEENKGRGSLLFVLDGQHVEDRAVGDGGVYVGTE